MGSWLLLGTDSLIACIAVGPIMAKRSLAVLSSFAVLFGVGDGLGYLLGCAIHWSYPDSLGFLAPTVVAVIGVYWIGVAIVSRMAAKAELSEKSHWGIWILPWLLSLDNITYGVVNGVSGGASTWLSAFEQFLSSALQAGVGLAVGIGIAAAIPAVRQRMWLANATAGVLMITGGIVMYVTGW
jgi:hypothetical protein